MARTGSELRPLSEVAQAELARCVNEGLTARQARLRLIRCGATLGERTISRRMLQYRADQQRHRELEAIGRGIGSVQIGATAANELLRASVPGWRQKQATAIRSIFDEFLREPAADLFAGIVVGCHALLLAHQLEDRNV
jgi:hypothetical protein